MATTADVGRRGEDLAVELLESKGYRVLDRNYRFGREEIDVVCFLPNEANDSGQIVVVEVKARSGTGFGAPEASVDHAKQKAILRVTEAYLHERRLMPSPVRFDVIAILFGDGDPTVEHFEYAFGPFV